MTPGQTLCVYCRERPAEEKWQPFCGERCRMLDLSRWLDGDYRVAGEPTEDRVNSSDAAAEDDATAPDATPNSRYARHHHDHR